MTIKARNPLAPDWFTPPSEEESATPARFKLQPLNGLQVMDVYAYYNSETRRITGRGAQLALQYGLLDWENISDDSGAAIKFSLDEAGRLPTGVLNAVANRIVQISMLSETERKN